MNLKSPILAAPLLPPESTHTDDEIFAAMKQCKYPVGVTLKKDGVRGIRANGTLLSRSLKKIPNKSIRDAALIMPGGFDMELWNQDLEYHQIESIVMSAEHPDSDHIQFHVLDWMGPATEGFGYAERCRLIGSWMNQAANDVWKDTVPRVKFAPPLVCHNAEQLFAFYKAVVQECGEGICFRTLDSRYKQGRSTLKEQCLVKLAPFIFEEARVVAIEEQMENGNTEKHNATGKMDRSSFAGNKQGKNTLGVLIGEDIKTSQLVRCGTGLGLTKVLRQHIWNNFDQYKGKMFTYKHKPHGKKNLPRSPIFHGWRKEGY